MIELNVRKINKRIIKKKKKNQFSSFLKAGKQIIKFNNHRLQYDPDFRLVLVSRLYATKFPKEISSLCTVLDLRPTPYLVESDIERATMRLMRPRVELRRREILYTAFTVSQQLSEVDHAMMAEIQKNADSPSQQMWKETKALDSLSHTRTHVCTVNIYFFVMIL